MTTRPENQTPDEQAGLLRAAVLLSRIEELDQTGDSAVNETADALLELREQCAPALLEEARRKRVGKKGRLPVDEDAVVADYLKTSKVLKTRSKGISRTRVAQMVRYAKLRRSLVGGDTMPTNTGMARPLVAITRLKDGDKTPTIEEKRAELWRAAVAATEVGGWPATKTVRKVVADAGYAPVKKVNTFDAWMKLYKGLTITLDDIEAMRPREDDPPETRRDPAAERNRLQNMIGEFSSLLSSRRQFDGTSVIKAAGKTVAETRQERIAARRSTPAAQQVIAARRAKREHAPVRLLAELAERD